MSHYPQQREEWTDSHCMMCGKESDSLHDHKCAKCTIDPAEQELSDIFESHRGDIPCK